MAAPVTLYPFGVRTLETDSEDLSFLYSAARQLSGNGATIEIGLRRGGGTEAIVRGLADGGRRGWTHIAVDPYGDIDYVSWNRISRCDYTNQMRDESLPEVHRVCAECRVNFIYMPLEDVEFFSRFSDGIPTYLDNRKLVVNDYALVHFDGPHGMSAVLSEVQFFGPRSAPGTHWIFDDPTQYDHDVYVDPIVRSYGFELVRSAYKRWYVRGGLPGRYGGSVP